MNWKRGAKWAVVQKLRFERGKTYASAAQNLAALLILFQLWGLAPVLQAVLGLGALLGLWLIGYADEKKIKAWQFENEYAAGLNPMLRRIDGNTKKRRFD